jgi:hypothetical protein
VLLDGLLVNAPETEEVIESQRLGPLESEPYFPPKLISSAMLFLPMSLSRKKPAPEGAGFTSTYYQVSVSRTTPQLSLPVLMQVAAAFAAIATAALAEPPFRAPPVDGYRFRAFADRFTT